MRTRAQTELKPQWIPIETEVVSMLRARVLPANSVSGANRPANRPKDNLKRLPVPSINRSHGTTSEGPVLRVSAEISLTEGERKWLTGMNLHFRDEASANGGNAPDR